MFNQSTSNDRLHNGMLFVLDNIGAEQGSGSVGISNQDNYYPLCVLHDPLQFPKLY